MKKSLYNRFFTGIARIVFPKCEVVFEEENDEPGMYLCNHSGAIGPVLMTLYFPKKHKTWMINYVMEKEKNANYIFHDFCFGRARKHKKFWRFLSKIVAKMLPPLLKEGNPIPVYHNPKILETFRETEDALERGENLVVFPEEPKRFSEFVHNVYEGFADAGRTYYKQTGKRLKFYPVYAEKKNRKILVGKPIEFDPDMPIKPQRKIIAEYIRDNIDRLARTLPPHPPTPFLPDLWYQYYGEYENNPMEYWKLFDENRE